MRTAQPGSDAAEPPLIELPAPALEFVVERHLATLTVLRRDGTPHVAPVGFTWDAEDGLARVITWAGAVKARLLAEPGRAALCQVDGGRWLTLEGLAQVTSEAGRVSTAVAGYAARYREPKQRTDRVAIEIAVDRVMGSVLR